ncbi:ras-related protein Rab-36 isoform X2 [Equus quagga]|uniref:ras-related protein Rab-36 isoform X2 n=1 Tax=Equus quagga TaxID=89248 RepID=UPI001EE17A54|nr:ras-related protein Rab-36 isoform X2 [Equus quagga]
MRSSLMPLGPPVSRDRVITSFPKCYMPDACLQLKEHFHGQVSAACQRRNTGTVGLKLSKVVVVGDLYVGKTSLIHRFCKNVFDRDYKATIGVDFEIERFEIAGVPYSLQIWDTAGQEKFKCIASAYYRGAQVIITAFDLSDVQTLEHTRQWLEDALRENEPGSCFVFLVGTKKDLLSGAACEQAEAEAVRLANELQAEYWSVSAKTGENVKAFFSRVAALAFEQSVLQDLERRSSARLQVGDGDLIRPALLVRGRGWAQQAARAPPGPLDSEFPQLCCGEKTAQCCYIPRLCHCLALLPAAATHALPDRHPLLPLPPLSRPTARKGLGTSAGHMPLRTLVMASTHLWRTSEANSTTLSCTPALPRLSHPLPQPAPPPCAPVCPLVPAHLVP